MTASSASTGLQARLTATAEQVWQRVGPTIQRFFRPSYQWTDDGPRDIGVIPTVPGGACLVPRTQLLFARIDIEGVPGRQRRDAVLLELEQTAPFEAPLGWVDWQGETACVWYWPRDLETDIEQALGARLPIIPESALWSRLAPGEYRWIELSDTNLFLLQYQHPEEGLHEKRSLSPIGEEEARAWLSRHGATASAVEPAALAPLSASRHVTGESLTRTTSTMEQRWLPATSALLAFLMVTYTLATGFAWINTQLTRADRTELQSQVDQVVALRDRARDLAATNRRLIALQQPSQLTLAWKVADALDLRETELVRWAWRNDRLELSWQSDTGAMDATAVIRRLEAQPDFRNVQASTGDSLIEVSLEVVDAPDGAPAPTGSTTAQATNPGIDRDA